MGFYPGGFPPPRDVGPAEVFDVKIIDGTLRLHHPSGCRNIDYDLTNPNFKIEDVAQMIRDLSP